MSVSLAASPWGKWQFACELSRVRGDENHPSHTITSDCEILGKALYDWMTARQAREAQGWRKIEEGSRERTSQAWEAEQRWKIKTKEEKKRPVAAKELTTYVCLYSNPSVM